MDIGLVADLVKIGLGIASVVLTYTFRKQIVRAFSDIVVGGNTSSYEGATLEDILKRIDDKMDGMLK